MTTTDIGFRSINNKLTLDDGKMSALERTCGDLKKKVGTLESTIFNLYANQAKMVTLMKEQVTEHQSTNDKIQTLYSNRYGDSPPTSVSLSGLTVEIATKREFDAHSATISIAQSIRDLQASVSTLFKSQELISQDDRVMSKAFAQTREDMNLLILNQQQIMAALKLPTPIINTAVPTPSNIPSSSARP